MGNLIQLRLSEQEKDEPLVISWLLLGDIQGLVCPLHHHVRLLGWKIVRRPALFAMSQGRIKRYCTKHPLSVLMLESDSVLTHFRMREAFGKTWCRRPYRFGGQLPRGLRRIALQESKQEVEVLRPDGVVLAELVTYIEETRATSDKEHPAVFKLSTLGNMYYTRIAQLLNEPTPRSKYPTRLKQRLITHLPGLQDYKQGQNFYLAFRTDLAATVHSVHKSSDEEAIHLARAVSIVRKDIFSKKCQFHGSIEKGCQLKSVPASLLSLVNMILYGASIDMQSDAISKSQVGLTVSQVIQFSALYDDAVKT